MIISDEVFRKALSEAYKAGYECGQKDFEDDLIEYVVPNDKDTALFKNENGNLLIRLVAK